MTRALLRGREHLRLGAVDLVAEASAAVAISRGGAPKRYAHVDPNEDCAAFAAGRDALLLVVADGHHGFEAAELAVSVLLEGPGAAWVDDATLPSSEQWARHAVAALCDANDEILRERESGGSPSARSTLAVALVRPDADELLYASIGDSHVFLVGAAGEAADHAASGEPVAFLGGSRVDPAELAKRVAVGRLSLTACRAVVLATDGLSAPDIGVADPPAAVAAAVEDALLAPPALRPAVLARRVAERALDAQRRQRAGDNVAVAVGWLGGRL